MCDFEKINWAEKIIELIFAIIQALIIAYITRNAFDRILQKEKAIGKRLKNYGIESVKSGDGKMTTKHEHIAFGQRGYDKPTEMDLCFITGRMFFQNFQFKNNINYIGELVQSNCRVRVLLVNPYDCVIYRRWKIRIDNGDLDFLKQDEYINYVAEFYYKIIVKNDPYYLKNSSFIERTEAILLRSMVKPNENSKEKCIKIIKNHISEYGDFRYQVLYNKIGLEKLNERASTYGSIEVRFYEDEYRMPITLVKKNANKNKEATTFLWTNTNAATRETTDSINIFFKVKESERSELVDDIEETFRCLWNRYPPMQSVHRTSLCKVTRIRGKYTAGTKCRVKNPTVRLK